MYGGRESSTPCNFRTHMQIEKALANKENILISLTAHVLQVLTTQPITKHAKILTTQTEKRTAITEMRCKYSQHN